VEGRYPQTISQRGSPGRISVAADGSLRGVGATFAGMFLTQDRVAIAHLGDCRVHQIRQDQFLRRTADHRIADPRHRRIITRGFGMNSNPEVVSWDMNLRDVFLLTGGVHDLLTDDELLLAVLQLDPRNAARAILDLAVSRGAAGCQTVLIVRS
jgi:serine/threonine protein phosphatase PrpC